MAHIDERGCFIVFVLMLLAHVLLISLGLSHEQATLSMFALLGLMRAVDLYASGKGNPEDRHYGVLYHRMVTLFWALGFLYAGLCLLYLTWVLFAFAHAAAVLSLCGGLLFCGLSAAVFRHVFHTTVPAGCVGFRVGPGRKVIDSTPLPPGRYWGILTAVWPVQLKDRRLSDMYELPNCGARVRPYVFITYLASISPAVPG